MQRPYLAAGTHMPDISVVTPVFVAGEVRFFTANIGHHADVGGRVPGSIAADALSVFEEGSASLRLASGMAANSTAGCCG